MGKRNSTYSTQPTLQFIDDLEVWVTRKRIKNLHLRVKPPDGRVEVSAPFNLSDAFVTSFIREKRDWIRCRQEEIAHSPVAHASQASKQEINEWRQVVSACVPPLVAAWEPIMGVQVQQLTYRNMTSRWGSCQPATGKICINTRLALYPPECLEYVVVHEMCHLIERGHGPRFKELMNRYLPDWRWRKDKLRA